ncbi:Transcriptional factor SWI5 [Madurella fahalii]|uniref:Transcriptional factor SWI5 n=1 Tax=Madurella fahalii TaxID=1157608 RepID=A0ABQ0GLF7_9PEZI
MATLTDGCIRQLAYRYPLPELIRFLKDVEPLLNDQGMAQIAILESQCASRPSSSLSTAGGWSLHSPFDRPSSGMGYSDTSSISDGVHSIDTPSIPAQTGPDSQSCRGRTHGYRATTGHRISKAIHKLTTPSASSALHSPKKTSFECPYCSEVKMPSSISRKADLKRHFMQFHQTDAQWLCLERGCGMAFDWKSAFEWHVKQAHHNVHHPHEKAMVKLCPQLVFACGFTNCRLVFEASSSADADETAKKYFNHVLKHFDDNLTHRNWSYSTRFRNLLRQKGVADFWKNRKKGGQDPEWQPHTSNVLRKMLETRHLPDVFLVIEWAMNLGCKPFCEPFSPVPKLPAKLRLPVKENCNSCDSALAGHCLVADIGSHRTGPKDAVLSSTNPAGLGEIPMHSPGPVPCTEFLSGVESQFPMVPQFQIPALEPYADVQQQGITAAGSDSHPVYAFSDGSASLITRQPVSQWLACEGQPAGISPQSTQSAIPACSYLTVGPMLSTEYCHQVLGTDGGRDGIASQRGLGTPQADFEMGDCPHDPHDEPYY